MLWFSYYMSSVGQNHIPRGTKCRHSPLQPSFLATPPRQAHAGAAVRGRVPRLRRRVDRQHRAAVDPPRRCTSRSQGLQWVPSGYLLTYGGFMLLGGRAADLLGRRRVLVAGIVADRRLVARSAASPAAPACSIGARLAQGLGAAMMLPAALSILTTTLQGGQGPPHGARRLGRRRRAGVRRRRAARRPADRGPRLALGDVRQPARRACSCSARSSG